MRTMLFDRRKQIVKLQRFMQMTIRPVLRGFLAQKMIGGHQNDRNLCQTFIFFRTFEETRPVHHRHYVIEENQVGHICLIFGRFFQHENCSLSVRRTHRGITLAFHRFNQGLANIFFIINHKNQPGHSRLFPRHGEGWAFEHFWNEAAYSSIPDPRYEENFGSDAIAIYEFRRGNPSRA